MLAVAGVTATAVTGRARPRNGPRPADGEEDEDGNRENVEHSLSSAARPREASRKLFRKREQPLCRGCFALRWR